VIALLYYCTHGGTPPSNVTVLDWKARRKNLMGYIQAGIAQAKNIVGSLLWLAVERTEQKTFSCKRRLSRCPGKPE
jgi:hypothetical protein